MRGPVPAIGMLCLLALPPQGTAMQQLDDAELASFNGAGIAFALQDFRFQMAPTSYIEQIGQTPSSSTVFNRGDLRWYGLTISGTRGTGLSWSNADNHGCTNGLNAMGCPMTDAPVGDYGGHNNPFLLRSTTASGVGLATPTATVWQSGVSSTLLEVSAPSRMDDFLWSFWGDIEAGKGGITHAPGVAGIIQTQNIIRGKPSAPSRPGGDNWQGPLLQIFQSMGSPGTVGHQTFGLLYHSRLSGDYRFSVNQIDNGLDTQGVPRFTDEEGLYFTNVQAYLPLGQLHYQSIVFASTPEKDGNFVMEVTRIPDSPAAYQDFYSSADSTGYKRTERSDRYYQTHGYVRWGNQFPSCAFENCLSGTGVSQVRFAGPGVVTSHSLPAVVVNADNFPVDDLCESGRGGPCDSFAGNTAAAVPVTLNINLSNSPLLTPSSREQVAGSGGMAFVSRSSSSTWRVASNQNAPDVFSSITILRDVMLARTDNNRTSLVGCGFLSSCWELAAKANPDTSAIQRSAQNFANQAINNGTFNPLLEVNAINLGSSRIEGLQINHMQLISLGAGRP